MNCFLLVAPRDKGTAHIALYAQKNNIVESSIATFNEKIVVDTVRTIRRNLSFKSRRDEQKIVVLNNEITIEAQNALLKCIEELSENTTIFIVSQRNETILPTIASRCSVITLKDGHIETDKKADIQKGIWSLIESFEEKTSAEEQLMEIIMRFRTTLLKSDLISERQFAYETLKKLLKLSPLVLNNNVQLRIVLEKILFENLTLISVKH